MKTKFDSAIVVEGNTDAAFLNTFIEADIITTNGSDVPRETIIYLATLSKIKPLIVLTDPDGPGQLIRHKLDQSIVGLRHAYIPKETAIRSGRVGVAYAPKEVILEALSKADAPLPSMRGTIAMAQLYDLGLFGQADSKEKRVRVAAALGLGYPNGKQLLNRINSLNINIEKIREALAHHG